jgi:hypothetical protein
LKLCIADPPYPPFVGSGGGGRFIGAKPAAWTRWVLDAMTYDPESDEVFDMFHGSGSVTDALSQGTLI